MIIRFAKDKNLDDIKMIWKYCFNDEESFMHYYFDKKYKKENTILIEEDDEVIASLQLNKYTLNLNDKKYDVSYVVGVSTLPHKRGKGYMKHLMKKAFMHMYDSNEIVSILMPIDYRLYRKYGYENCYDILEYDINIDDLKDFSIKGDFTKAHKKNIEDLVKIYTDALKFKNGYVIRDKHYFKNFFDEISSENGYIYMHKTKNIHDGYIVYFIQNNDLIVRELFYDNINTLKDMMKFLYSHNTQCKKVKIHSFIDDAIKDILSNPKECEIKIKPFMMGRVINAYEYFKNIDLSCNIDIKIKIIDDMIKENNSLFHITNTSVKKILDESINPDVVIDINTLSQIAFSYIDIEKAIFLEKISINKENSIQDLNHIFNKKTNYICEYI